MHNACSFGHAEVVQLLLKHGADPNAHDNWNYTPLHEAAIKGKTDVCIGMLNDYVKYYIKTICHTGTCWNIRVQVFDEKTLSAF